MNTPDLLQSQDESPARTAHDVVELLRARYESGVHVTLAEVRDAAGFSASRSCDVISICTWPSRGLTLRGFEVKVSRADWKKELADPSKAEAFAPYCDEWYVAAGSSKIVQADELPETWGLLVARGKRLDCVKPAVKNPSPLPIDRGLLVALMKRAVEQGPTQKALDGAHQNGVASGRSAAERELRGHSVSADASQRLRDLERRILDFERASGISLLFTTGDPTRLGRAVRAVLDGTDGPVKQRAGYVVRELESIVKQLKEVRDLPPIELPDSGGLR